MPLIDETYLAALKARLQLDESHNAAAGPVGAGLAKGDKGEYKGDKVADEGDEGECGEARVADEDDEATRAYKKILKLVSYSERSSQMLIDRLTHDGFSPDAAHAALERAQRVGIVDDRRYADALLRSRFASGHGRQGIRRELEELGIVPEGLESWYTEEQDELSRALSFLERKPPTAKNRRDAAYRKLVTKGYSSDIASSAARIWSESA